MKQQIVVIFCILLTPCLSLIGGEYETIALIQTEEPESVHVALSFPKGETELRFFFVELLSTVENQKPIFVELHRSHNLENFVGLKRHGVAVTLRIDLDGKIVKKFDNFSNEGKAIELGAVRDGYYLRRAGEFVVTFTEVTKDGKLISSSFPSFKLGILDGSNGLSKGVYFHR